MNAIYMVENGNVTLFADATMGSDVLSNKYNDLSNRDGFGSDCILAKAQDEKQALGLAKLFDEGKIDNDNVDFNGVTISALQSKGV